MAAPKPVRSEMRPERLKILSGNANPKLSRDICAELGVPTAAALS